MTQPEEQPSLEDMHNVLRGMQVRMRNCALRNCDHIDFRTLVALQDLNLFKEHIEPIGANVDLEVLRDPNHPRRIGLPPGPLLTYLTQDKEPIRMVIEVHVLLLSELPDIRKAAFTYLDRQISDKSFAVTPKTLEVLDNTRTGVMSETPHIWRVAAIALCDAFNDDVLAALHMVQQCLKCEPVVQDILDKYVPRVLHPVVPSLDSIALEVKNPELEHPRLLEVMASVIRDAESLKDACSRYYAKLGYLPLAPPYSMSEVVSRWIAGHTTADVWAEVWQWEQGASGPIPRYHACSVFILHPELIPDGRLPELWQVVLGVLNESGRKCAEGMAHEPYALRRDLARHFVYRLEAQLPDNDGASIACFAWWFTERLASVFPNNPESAQFYRKNWVKPAAEQSAHIWLAASPHIGRSFLRYVTAAVSSPWATALLALMGNTMERLAPQEQSVETQALFNESLLYCLIGSLPFSDESPADPTYAQECALSKTARKWAALQPEDKRTALEQLVAINRTLCSVEGLCDALRSLTDRLLDDQIAVILALKAKAYTDPSLASGMWEVLSDAEWRQRVLGSVDDRVLGLIIEVIAIIQADNRGKWFSLLPHYIAELCEKTEDDNRRRQLFLYVIHTSLASNTVSAVLRLLRGGQNAKYIPLAKDYRERVEAMREKYPKWVEGKFRGFWGSLGLV
ncbi:MAG: hypothetical protein GX634_10455 [Lentisphaerae bacterium]|nr:hypothetical protein [Lentisphaerota bacterium]